MYVDSKLDKLLLKVPKTFASYGDRAFSSCAPKLWNSLPMDIRSCVSINAYKKKKKKKNVLKQRTSHSFKENQPMHRRRNFLNENFNENS